MGSLFDSTLLTSFTLYVALGAFAATCLLLAVATYLQPAWLKVPGKSQVLWGGGAIVAVAMTGVFFLDMPLYLRWSFLAAALLTAVVGWYDERRRLGPGRQFAWQLAIVALVVTGGWSIPYISHPVAGVITLTWWTFGPWSLPAALLAALWLLAVLNAVNWLDGVDGLASTICLVAFVALAAIALLPVTQDKLTLSLSLLFAGTLGGFLLWNLPPAKFYLGTAGSWFLGLSLGLTAIVGGGKIATALLLLIWPLADAFFVIGRRVHRGQKPWQGGADHLHHYLLYLGVPIPFILFLAAAVSIALAAAAVLLSTPAKLLVLLGIACLLGLYCIFTKRRV